MNFLTVLTLETRRDPAVCANVWHASDASEHVTRNHDERSGDGSQSPGPTGLENGSSEPKDEDGAKTEEGGEDNTSPVNGFTVGDCDGGMPGEGFGEWRWAKTSGERERVSMRVGKVIETYSWKSYLAGTDWEDWRSPSAGAHVKTTGADTRPSLGEA